MSAVPEQLDPYCGKNRHYYHGDELGEGALFNAFKPTQAIKHESARHRQIVDLKIAGLRNIEIAEITGVAPFTVSKTVQQPWAQKRIVEKIEQNTQNAVKAMIESAAKEAIVRVVEMAGDENLKFKHPKLYAELNESLLDRYLGKAPQVVETKTSPSDMTDEEQEVRLAELRARNTITE